MLLFIYIASAIGVTVLMAEFISYILAIPGFLSAGYLLWKRFKKEVDVFPITAEYKVMGSEKEERNRIEITTTIGFLNKSEHSISITDVIGILKYNKEMYNKYLKSIVDVPNIPNSYDVRPIKFGDKINFSVKSHESLNKEFTFSFPELIIKLLQRMNQAHFMGFINKGKTAIFHVHEKELYENWSQLPIQFLIVFHIDGKKIEHVYTWVPKAGSDIKVSSGTLDLTKIEKIKINDFKDNAIHAKIN